MQGKFITFEGPEGSGKSTHIELLATWLRTFGLEVLTTREPGGTRLGDAIRALLQHNGSGEAPVPHAELLLFLASRAQHVAQLIQPALVRGAWVLCDRFNDSTLAYQGYGRGFALNTINTLNDFATSQLRPDLTILLDIPPDVSRARIQRRQNQQPTDLIDRIENEPNGFHQRLRQGFLELARAEPHRFVVIDSQAPQARVSECIQAELTHRLHLKELA